MMHRIFLTSFLALVGQVVNLRRIGNPPAARFDEPPRGRQQMHGRLAAASRRRINNPPQIANLPHNHP